MKRFLASVLALGLAATSLPSTASARDWHHNYSYRHDRGNAVAAGVVGLALGAVLGAAITNSNHRRYDRRYSDCYDRCGYDRGYARDGYYEDGYSDGYDQPSLCIVRERRYDPYTGRAIFIEERRPC
ncbi:MAG: hypothetical protein WAU68_04930 [Vitreimonas sp.]